MEKTIADYKADYEVAKARGDANGMRNANDAANQLRNKMGLPAEFANQDIAKIQVQADKKQALSSLNSTYDGMINQTDKYYQAQIDASKQWAETQKKNQQEQTDFAIEQIEQQKAQAKKDYTNEQSGAYVDWQKQSNQYGVSAEQMAAQGMANGGYTESSQVSMYNTYQNRVATARETYNRAVLNYDNAIKDARLQNNAALAEIAYQALQTQLELSLQGFQYKNTLIMAKTDKGIELDNIYHDRYQDVLAQINTENALAEEIRQYNESMAEEKRQYNESLALQKAQLAEEQRQFNALHPTNPVGGGDDGGDNPEIDDDKKPKRSAKDTHKLTVNEKKQQAASNKNKSNVTVDTKSVLALGYGPISGSRLAELENRGLIESYRSGNKIKYRKSAYSAKQLGLYNSLK